MHYNASKCKADDVVKQLKLSGVNAVVFQADLSKYDNVRKLYTDVVAQMGPVDILFNNSGVTNTVIGPQGNIQDISIDEFESTWRTNTGSSYLVSGLHLLIVREISLHDMTSSSLSYACLTCWSRNGDALSFVPGEKIRMFIWAMFSYLYIMTVLPLVRLVFIRFP